MSNAIKIINTVEEFQSLIETSDKPVLVDFWATWCPPCRIMNPILNDLAEAREDVIIAKVDVDALPDVSNAFRIQSIPTILSFKEGKLENHRIIGAVPKEMLNKHIDSL